MRNCILKINKDRFFAFEEEMKNDMLFFRGQDEVRHSNVCQR